MRGLTTALIFIVFSLHLVVGKKTIVQPGAKDDASSVDADFDAYKKEIKEAKAKKAFLSVRQLAKANPGKVSLDSYAHYTLDELKKIRLGLKPAPITNRLTAAPKLSIKRHRGALKKLSKGITKHKHNSTRAKTGKKSGKGKRQTDLDLTWDQYLDWLKQYGYDTSALDNTDATNIDQTLDQLPADKLVIPMTEVPLSLDHRENGYVTSVKDQGGCGSCYTFSTTAAIEGQRAACYGLTENLAPQQIVSCSANSQYGTNGCDGGDPAGVFRYIKDNKGISLESYYQYAQRESTTVAQCAKKPLAPNSEVASHAVLPESEVELQKALAAGPIAVCINAGNDEFMHFTGDGLYEGPCEGDIDHAVTLVGYGIDEATNREYWLVKNSWGPDWGTDGYVKIPRNANNKCKIASYAVIPTLVGCGDSSTSG